MNSDILNQPLDENEMLNDSYASENISSIMCAHSKFNINNVFFANSYKDDILMNQNILQSIDLKSKLNFRTRSKAPGEMMEQSLQLHNLI